MRQAVVQPADLADKIALLEERVASIEERLKREDEAAERFRGGMPAVRKIEEEILRVGR